jgi:hypothetical protein
MSTQSPDDLPTLPPPAVAEPVISEKQHPDRQHKGRLMETPQRLIATVLKLFLLSVVVGWLISVLNITIEGFFGHIADAFGTLVDWTRWFLSWTLPYAAVGAVIVVPLWVISVLLRLGRRQNRGPEEPPS